jgi:hypothetical protein
MSRFDGVVIYSVSLVLCLDTMSSFVAGAEGMAVLAWAELRLAQLNQTR